MKKFKVFHVLLLFFLTLTIAVFTKADILSAAEWGCPSSNAVVNPVVRSPLQRYISLNGEWDFNTGDWRIRWSKGKDLVGYDYELNNCRKIRVPGCWEAQGVGSPGNGETWDCTWDNANISLTHKYMGAATYRKFVDIPEDWSGCEIYLKVGGVRTEAYIWVNSCRAAYINNYCATEKFNIAPFIKTGQTNEIIAFVRNDTPSRKGLLAVNHKFGGFYRDIELEAVPQQFIDDVWVTTEKICTDNNSTDNNSTETNGIGSTVGNGQYAARVNILVRQELSRPFDGKQSKIEALGKWSGTLEVTITDVTADTSIADIADSTDVATAATIADNTDTAQTTQSVIARKTIPVTLQSVDTDSNEIVYTISEQVSVLVPEIPRLWSPESPNLYYADVRLLDAAGNPVHGWTERFGVRELKTVGSRIYLNGKPYFLRGGGDHNNDPITVIEPNDRNRFIKHEQLYKAAGFNCIRSHTHCPYPEYFEAAEEVGLLIQPELPYYHDVPTEGFVFDPMRDITELYMTNRRYVSFGIYSTGNEGYLGWPIDEQLYKLAKETDPDRLFMHQDGGKNTATNSDLASPNGYGLMTSIVPWPAGTYDSLEMPFIAHEYLNLAIKPDPRLEPRFNGLRVPPRHMSDYLSLLQLCHLDDTDWGQRCLFAAGKLQGIYQKEGLEAARWDPACDGFSYWSLIDAGAAAQGWLTPFWEVREGGLQPNQFREFNGPTTLLLKTSPGHCTVTSGDTITCTIGMSHFGSENITGRDCEIQLVTGLGPELKVLWSKEVTVPEIIETGFVGTMATVELEIPEIAQPCEARWVLRMKSGENSESSDLTNHWPVWLFPRRTAPVLDDVLVSPALLEWFGARYKGVEEFTAEKAGPGTAVIALIDDEILSSAIESGCRILLISPAVSTPDVRLGWWSIGSQVGTAITDRPIFGTFPCENYMNGLWFRLIRKGAQNLRNKSQIGSLEPLIVGEGADTYYTYLAQAQVGSAKILASFALEIMDETQPESMCLLDNLIQYIQSESFVPSAKGSIETSKESVPEGTFLGYDRVISRGSETAIGLSYRSDQSFAWSCRQVKQGNELVWKTPAVKKGDLDKAGKNVTFVFAGGLGYQMEPATDGFELTFNGLLPIRFDLPTSADQKTAVWKFLNKEAVCEEDLQQAELLFKILRVTQPGPDYFGKFFLTVPVEAVKPDQPQTIQIRSLGQGSRRWFGLNTFKNLGGVEER